MSLYVKKPKVDLSGPSALLYKFCILILLPLFHHSVSSTRYHFLFKNLRFQSNLLHRGYSWCRILLNVIHKFN